MGMASYRLVYYLNEDRHEATFADDSDDYAIGQAEGLLAGDEYGKILPIAGGAILTNETTGQKVAKFGNDLDLVWSIDLISGKVREAGE